MDNNFPPKLEFFSINDEDLPPIISVSEEDIEQAAKSIIAPPLIQVSLQDIAAIEAQFLRLTEKDLPPIIQISAKDLPPIIKIGLSDLVPDRDLTNVTTNCYHGTSREVAEKVKREGFLVGNGAALGSGIYFSVGNMTIAKGYLKGTPCIIRAKVDWGKVAYLDDPETMKKIGGSLSGDAGAQKGLSLGYNSFIQSSKYSEKTPTVGIVLGKQGTYVKPPRIEIVELLDPNKI